MGGVPDEISIADIEQRLLNCGKIDYCYAPVEAEGVMLHRVKFEMHSMAEKAVGKAQELQICKFAFIAYRDYDLYENRGW